MSKRWQSRIQGKEIMFLGIEKESDLDCDCVGDIRLKTEAF